MKKLFVLIGLFAVVLPTAQARTAEPTTPPIVVVDSNVIEAPTVELRSSWGCLNNCARSGLGAAFCMDSCGY
ncbi:MAG: hypothetical protein U0Z75_01840 [Deinococcaceae bacterium]